MQDHHSFSDFNRDIQTRRYIKPTICSRNFLTTMSINLRAEKEWGHHLAKVTGVDVTTIVELNLEFSNIQSTYGLGYLRSCQKLKLNNNIISKIIGMDDLKALKILDLSFNSIDRIEGLDECLDLEELLLFRNTISKIEGVSMMKKLVIFNLGSNLVKEIEEIDALRHLPALRSLNLEGNPVCRLPDYRQYVVLWLSQISYLDWKRVLPSEPAAASQNLKDLYRSFVSKEKAEEKEKEKGRKAEEMADAEAKLKKREGIIPTEYNSNLYQYLNTPENQLHFFVSHIADGQIALQSYRQQIVNSGQSINKKFCQLLQLMQPVATGFGRCSKKLIENYAACGRILVQGFISGKCHNLDAIKEEVENEEKEKLRQYCHLIDDVSHDLVKLLMQLHFKMEELLKKDMQDLTDQMTQGFSWMIKEVEVVQKFEEYFFKWVDDSKTTPKDQKWTRILKEEEVEEIGQDLTQPNILNGDDFWLPQFQFQESLKKSSMRGLMEALLVEKTQKLAALKQAFSDRLNLEQESLSDLLEDRQEKIYHCRMQEILHFVQQHKAEAYLTRKRAMIERGRQETEIEDPQTEPEVRNILQRKAKRPTSGRLERLKDLQFESDQPLADHIVIKDIKDVVDQIAHIPLAERKRLFETPVVDLDDIADDVHFKDQ